MQDPTTNLARQALSDAQQLAQQAHHPELTPTHLAASLLASPEGVTAGFLAKLGIETQALLAGVRGALERLPRSQGGELGMSRALGEALTEAQQAARALEDEYVSTEHLLLGLARAGGPEVSGLLAARGLTADIGVVVHNVATALAVHDALVHGHPLISRVITVSGSAIRQPRNLRVLIGTPLEQLVEHCDGFAEEPARLISGGPMMGQPLPSTRVPAIKGSNGLLALTQAETRSAAEMPCIRCASCVQACPCGLVPLEMAAQIQRKNAYPVCLHFSPVYSCCMQL